MKQVNNDTTRHQTGYYLYIAVSHMPHTFRRKQAKDTKQLACKRQATPTGNGAIQRRTEHITAG